MATVRQAYDHVAVSAGSIGITGIGNNNPVDINRILDSINRGMQTIWMSPKDETLSFTRTDHPITTTEGNAKYALPSSVMTVVGPCARILKNEDNAEVGRTPVLRCSTVQEYHDIPVVYEHSPSQVNATGSPTYYYPHGEFAGAGQADATKGEIWLYPIPDGEYSLSVMVKNEPPRFDRSHLCDGVTDGGTPTPLPIPHQFAESILYPLALFFQITHYRSFHSDRIQDVHHGYRLAMQSLGYADLKINKDLSEYKRGKKGEKDDHR